MAATKLLSNARQLPRQGSYRCAFIGDSIISNAHQTAYSGGGIVGTPTLMATTVQSWIPWLETLSYGAIRCPAWLDQTTYPLAWSLTGQRGLFGMNFGVDGDTSAGIISRLDGTVQPCILDLNFDIAFLEGGSNDVTAGVLSSTQIAANMIAAIDLLLARGVFVIVLPIRARAVTSWSVVSNKRKVQHDANQRIKAACLGRRNCMYINWDQAWADSTTTDGEPFANYSIDGIHDDTQGGYAIAKYMWFGKVGTTQVWPGLQAIFPGPTAAYNVAEDAFDLTNNLHGNLFINGTMSGTAGILGTGVTGTVASNQKVERASGSLITAVASVATPGGNVGQRQVATFTQSGAASETFYIPRPNVSAVDVSGLAGKWLEASFDIEVSVPYDKFTGIYCSVQEAVTSCNYRGMVGASAGHFMPNEAWQGRIHTPPFKLGAAPTTLAPRAFCVLTGGGAGSPVTNVGQFVVRVIEDPRDRYGWTGPAVAT